jgi:hypothetical protein
MPYAASVALEARAWQRKESRVTTSHVVTRVEEHARPIINSGGMAAAAALLQVGMCVVYAMVVGTAVSHPFSHILPHQFFYQQ